MYTIIAIYDSLKHFEVPIKEYQKRAWKDLHIVSLKPSKKGSIEEIKREETKSLVEILSKKKGYKILLDIGGTEYSTLNFVEFLSKKKQVNGDIIFVIWGTYGYTDELYSAIDFKFSLSPLTFPHNMALLILLEQLYRIQCIESGKQYHY